LEVEPDRACYLEVTQLDSRVLYNRPKIQNRTEAEAMLEISRLKGAKCFCDPDRKREVLTPQ
jgi:hypothetical protein